MTTPLFPFETRLHRKALSVHRPHHTSVADPWVTDPDKVEGMHIWWEWDSDTAPTKYKAWLRNPGNSAWIFLYAWHLDQTYAEGEVPVADADGYFLPATVEGGESGGGPATVEVEDEGTPEGPAGTFDFVGAGVSAAVAGGVATITIPGGGSVTRTYLGYNTIGASWEAMAAGDRYMKQITVAADEEGLSVEAYIRQTGDDSVGGIGFDVHLDNAGSIGMVIAHHLGFTDSLLLDSTAGAGGVNTGRWFRCAFPLAPGTYWVGITPIDNTAAFELAYDAGGDDRIIDASVVWSADGGFYSSSDADKTWSIRVRALDGLS